LCKTYRRIFLGAEYMEHILIIEDEKDVNRLLAQALEDN